MKLWNKGISLNEKIEKFTVGNDYILDKKLLKYDCLASIAHAKILVDSKILSPNEFQILEKYFKKIMSEGLEITLNDEDCHTAIENYLVKNCGDLGKKIHSLRSRNDQILVALRLYEKEELNQIKKLIFDLIEELIEIILKNSNKTLPGYTHMQKAMPMSIELWLGSFVNALEDDVDLLKFILNLIDQNPLGSAAGFGVPIFKLDSKITTKELGFSKNIKNSLYCQLSRPKFEIQILNTLSNTMFTLNKLSSDLMLFSTKEFGFVKLPEEFCTGSSIMPQKKNPDVLELIRAKYAIILGEEFKLKNLTTNLISGYNRDVQLSKEPLINSFEIIKETLEIFSLVLKGIEIVQPNLPQEIFATEEAYKLVQKGVPFRDAYKEIAKSNKYN